MTHTFIDPNQLNWADFIQSQEGRGPALASTPKYFQGLRYQRGGGVLGSIARFLMPIAKNIASTVGQEGISAGTKMLSDIAEGKNLKETLMEHSKKGLENIATKLQQCGKGKKRSRKNTKKNIQIPSQLNPTLKKRRYMDQLSYF